MDWHKIDRPIFLERIATLITRFTQEIERVPAILRGENKHELYDMEDLRMILGARLRIILGNTNITVEQHYPDWETISKKQVIWSREWLYTLAENIALNTIKAFSETGDTYKKFLVVSSKMAGSRKEKEMVDLIFDDNGPGFPEDIVTNGFSQGKTYWPDSTIQGEGTGMAYHAKILREHYGGDLIPEHRMDEAGNRIPGGRLRVRLPVAPPNP